MSLNVYISNDNKVFHLTNGTISYIIGILPNWHLGQLYYGTGIQNPQDFQETVEIPPRPMTSCPIENEWFSLEHVHQEYPVYGNSDFRQPALAIRYPDGSTVSDFKVCGFDLFDGKPHLERLPAVYTESGDEAKTLTIHLADEKKQLELDLFYSMFKEGGILTRSASLTNRGEKPVAIETMMSLSVDLPDSDYQWLQFSGAWGRERELKIRSLEQGITSVGSRRGHSSHNHNPFVIIKRPYTNEDDGEAIGFSLVYSGNFLIQAETDTYNNLRMMAGIHPDGFEWKLNPGQTFQTPECVSVYTQKGLNSLSQTYHKLYQKRLTRGYWRDRPRPILNNNWEATAFDFNEDRLIEIAKTAQNCGCELFVLDDGWFGARRNDKAGLGDWKANRDLLPNGIEGLCRRMNEMGMEFGLWFEPEMVNKDSDFYRSHPDWILEVPDRPGCHGRNQYVLDFTRKEVIDAIYDQMTEILDKAPLAYIKWDMNRSITEAYSRALPADQQGEVFHRYILGVYSLYERLIQRYPKILFESCASGGGRFDPGMLYYAPQAWCSDDSDGAERIRIQYGTSYGYPISSIGAHVSEIPNQQVYRNVPLHTRANVACFGTFGYELDLGNLSAQELDQVKSQVQFMKEYRNLLQFGTFYRLKSPFENNISAWMVVSDDRTQAIVGWYRTLSHVNQPFEHLKLKGLDPKMRYTIETVGKHKYTNRHPYGDELMHFGLITSDGLSGQVMENDKYYGDFDSRLFIINAESVQ